MTTTFSASSIG